MAQQRLIQAIGRIERALSRLERVGATRNIASDDTALEARHEALKAETQLAIREIDAILGGGMN